MYALSPAHRNTLSWTPGPRTEQCRAIRGSTSARGTCDTSKHSSTISHASRNSFTSSNSGTQQQSVLQRAFANPPQWAPFLGSLAVAGAALGTALDGIHSRVGLQVYDLAPVQWGPLTTSLLVPPLLLTFYVVLGLLACTADNLTAGSSATAAARRRMNPHESGSSAPAYLAACFGVLALNLYVSASFFHAETPPAEIFWVLGALAAVNWTCFDGTNQGVWLGLMCAVGAPAAELLLMSVTGCWHYSRPDLAGVFVSWVPLCYLFYVPAVSNLARYLWHTCRLPVQK
ncbi:hypothetical protein COO60DRAFT_1292431 [Scenedesmus sp. NREL 46B-D3]|nr:hypothetical protein COO60DRAFT_1292431 [Scenedesmus sp. NREL 46B-D3]